MAVGGGGGGVNLAPEDPISMADQIRAKTFDDSKLTRLGLQCIFCITDN